MYLHGLFAIFSLESLSTREYVQRLNDLNTPITNPDSGEISHRLAVAVWVHRNALLAHCRQHLEVVDIESRREGVEELGLLVERIGKGVRRARGHDDIVANRGVDGGVGLGLVGVEAQFARCYEKGLVVLRPVRYGGEREREGE